MKALKTYLILVWVNNLNANNTNRALKAFGNKKNDKPPGSDGFKAECYTYYGKIYPVSHCWLISAYKGFENGLSTTQNVENI